MSDADGFIQEVTEEVRRDRMFLMMRRYGPWALAVVVAVVAAAAVSAWLDHAREQTAQEAGGRLLAAVEAREAGVRAGDLLAAADALDAGPALAARLRAASELALAADAAGARRQFRSVAEDAATPIPFAAFAAFRAAVLDGALDGPAAALASLTPLTAEGAPFRLLALEARAAAYLSLGDRAAARADLAAVLADPAATDGLRLRAGELSAALGPAAP